MEINRFLMPHRRYQRFDECTNENGCERHYGRMKCTCMEASPSPAASYERLPNVPTLLELSELCARDDSEEKDTSNEKEEELVFYNDDGSCQSVVVEKNLCASDLCQLLALKNRVAKDVNWTIVEHLVELGLERSLEDHEDVLAAHHDSESYGKHSKKRFVYRKDFRKYEFFHNPQQFFPADMVDLNSCHQLTGSNVYNKTLALQTLLTHSGECPPIFSQVWVRETGNQRGWNKAFLLLKDRTLFLSYKVQVVAKILRAWKTNRDGGDSSGDSSPNLGEKKADGGELLPFAHLSECHVYTTLNARNQLRAPTEFGICLVPAAGSAIDGEPEQLQCLACESERARLCWVTAMRLAKYGKQLRENYRAFKNKQADAASPKEYNSFTVPHESVRSRVAMDFTGSVGRIVDDPAEAKAIAAAEGHLWKRRLRVPQARPAAPIVTRGLEAGVHVAQPWFHAGMTREQATRLVSRHGTVDGVFLVRESRSSPGAFVLTFKCGPKVLHTQVQPVVDTARDAVCFSLDGGATKFYDLLQLVEFYQLNSGVLATRLTHYVVQSPTGPIYRDKRPPT